MSTSFLHPQSHNFHQPVISTFDPSFDPSLLNFARSVPIGSRFEVVPHDGPGTAVYVRQPTRAQLKANSGLFGNPNRPFFYKDPLHKPFIDADGKECGPRWILVDPKEGEAQSGCCIM